MAGVLLILVGLLTKFAAVLAAIPDPMVIIFNLKLLEHF
jgi:xanthine/uracil permease